MLLLQSENGAVVLDQTPTGLLRLNVAEQVPVEVLPERQATPPVVLAELNVAAVNARPLRAGEVLAYLQRGTFGIAQEETLDPRLLGRPAEAALELYGELFLSRDVDTWTREPEPRSQSGQIRRGLAQALRDYVTKYPGDEPSGVAFASYLGSARQHRRALADLQRLAELMAWVGELLPDASVRRRFAELLVAEIVPENMSADTLIRAIQQVEETVATAH